MVRCISPIMALTASLPESDWDAFELVGNRSGPPLGSGARCRAPCCRGRQSSGLRCPARLSVCPTHRRADGFAPGCSPAVGRKSHSGHTRVSTDFSASIRRTHTHRNRRRKPPSYRGWSGSIPGVLVTDLFVQPVAIKAAANDKIITLFILQYIFMCFIYPVSANAPASPKPRTTATWHRRAAFSTARAARRARYRQPLRE